jgi:MoaA/NifB/PqqE/SkfB family radical SAM enzyme
MMFPRLHAFFDYVYYYLRTWEYLRRNLHPRQSAPIYPTIIQVGTHNRCNGRCQMCPYPDTVGKQPRVEMESHIVTRLVGEVAGWNLRRKRAGMFVFTLQNEPLLDARLPVFIREAREKLGSSWDVEITTNGVLMTGKMAQELAAAEPWAVNVSVNGFTQAAYDVAMPGFSVDKVFANIEEFLKVKSPKTKVLIRYVKQRANDAEFDALKRYWNARGVPVIGYGCNDRLGDVKDYENIRSRATGAVGEFFRRQIGSRVFSVCPFLFCQANILPTGKVLMCCHDYRHHSILGDLNSAEGAKSLADIFNTQDIWRDRREAHAGKYSGICLRCSLFKTHVWL